MRRRGIVARRAAALLTLAVLCASGCSGGDGADAATSLPPAPKASPHATPPAQPGPPRSTQSPTEAATTEAAATFAREYLQVLEQAVVSGKVDRYESLSEPGCESCRAQAQEIRRTYSSGGGYRGGAIDVLTAVAREEDGARDGFAVTVVFLRKPLIKLDDTGATAAAYRDPGETNLIMHVVHEPAGWRMADYTQIGKSS